MNSAATPSDLEQGFDYVVVGSGAGGGPLAANLAEAGMRVLLLEAGAAVENDNYRVPSFHGAATEDPELRWDMFVEHYGDSGRQARDSKRVEGKGVFYPRSGTLGGCTAHNAMITVCPFNRDWDDIAELTGDRSWRSRPMRRYFERLERCRYRRRPRMLPRNRLLAILLESLPLLSDKYVNRGRHGFDGWLETNLADPKLVTRDLQLLKVVLGAAEGSLVDFLRRPLTVLERLISLDPGDLLASLDPNDWQVQARSLQGIWLVPLATAGGRRNGTRERIHQVQQRRPQHLVVRTNTLVTRVLLDEANTATGVEYLDGPHLYRADARSDPDAAMPAPHRVAARREVILSAGAFNSPQLLMLSGIGPREELERHGIQVRVDRPGVGENLQDRYEVGIVSEMAADFALIEGCNFRSPRPGEPPDPCWEAWQSGKGVYTSNGAVLGVIRKSRPELEVPDLFIFGLPADFRGYQPHYSEQLGRNRSHFTWAVLKARTRNTGGRVRLRSADPRDLPEVNFHYFSEGTDTDGEDLDAVVTGIEFVRQINRRTDGVIKKELHPGAAVDSREELRQFIQDEAWGHHASCTCKMGRADDAMAVVDSRFRVHGVGNLRIVDASVFPRIPGFFVVTPVYMLSEKASDAILADARGGPRARRNRRRAASARRDHAPGAQPDQFLPQR
jgi:choline dehydrogenase